MTTYEIAIRSRMRRALALLLVACALAGCASWPNIQTDPPPATTEPQRQGWYAVDQLVRSTELGGIDLHLRAAERTATGLVLHLSFYNNGEQDLLTVGGVDLAQARLVGTRTYSPSERSPSFQNGIAPPGRWVSSGASVGTLTFEGVQGDTFELRVPAFSPIEFSLDQRTAAPMAEPLPAGTYPFGVEVISTQLRDIALRVERVTVQDETVTLDVAFVNRNPGDITFASDLTGDAAMLLDHQWQQYAPTAVAPAFAEGIAPAGDVWPEDAANTGMLTFPRPPSGNVLFLSVPTFPIVRLPLTANEVASAATTADLPPSKEPRPVAPTPTPRAGLDGARDAASRLLQSITTALGQRDREAYLAAFGAELQQEQGEIFDRIETLPLQEIRWEPAGGDDALLSADGSVLSNLRVDISYRVQDVDPDNLLVSTLTATLEQRDGGWVITALGGEPPFWAYNDTLARRSGSFWIFYRPSMEAELPAIEREAQQAQEQVNRVLPPHKQTVNVMYVAGTNEGFSAVTGRSGERFLGIAMSRFEVRASGIEIDNRVFFINGAAFRSDPEQDRQRTIAHELTHLLLSDSTMPYTPAWVSEGAAMYATDDFPLDTITQWYREQGPDTVDLATLSSQTSFGGHAGATVEQTSIQYAYSAFLANYLIETYGNDRFFEFYDSFADVPVDEFRAQLESGAGFEAAMSAFAPQVADQKMQAIYGIDLATLERNYEAWLADQLDA